MENISIGSLKKATSSSKLTPVSCYGLVITELNFALKNLEEVIEGINDIVGHEEYIILDQFV